MTDRLGRLRESIAWARERSVFYRARLGGLPLPETLDDLRRLPFTTPDDLIGDPMSFLCVPLSDYTRVVTLATSGTTSEPKRLFFTADDLDLTLGFFQRGLSTMAGPGDTILILLPGAIPDSVGDLLVRAAGGLGASAKACGFVADPLAAAGTIARERPDLVIGVPAQLFAAARAAEAAGLALAPVKRVLLCTDYPSAAIVHELERLWRAEVFEHWGMTELGYSGGVQCASHHGHHLEDADFLFEIVDPATGAVVPPGDFGEVTVTTLNRRGLPLIRYRTGDLSRLIPAPCPCGRPSPRLDTVRTRVKTAVELGNGQRLTIADLDETLFPLPGLGAFTATLARGTLRIGVWPVRPGGGASLLPAVRAALAALPVAVEVSLFDDPPPFGRAKRTIAVTDGN